MTHDTVSANSFLKLSVHLLAAHSLFQIFPFLCHVSSNHVQERCSGSHLEDALNVFCRNLCKDDNRSCYTATMKPFEVTRMAADREGNPSCCKQILKPVEFQSCCIVAASAVYASEVLWWG